MSLFRSLCFQQKETSIWHLAHGRDPPSVYALRNRALIRKVEKMEKTQELGQGLNSWSLEPQEAQVSLAAPAAQRRPSTEQEDVSELWGSPLLKPLFL